MTAATPDLRLACPVCDHVLTRREQGRMYPFWTGLQAHPCKNCGTRLIWHRSFHRALRIGAWIFRASALVVVASLIAAVVWPVNWNIFVFIACLAAWMAFTSAMIAAPKSQGRWLEVENDV